MMSEFSDRPFVAGSLTGIRSFRIDNLGRLTGVSLTKVWTPGDNTAKCYRMDYNRGGSLFASMPSMQSYMNQMNQMLYGRGYIEVQEPKPKPVSLVKKPPHQVASLKCECGFWAYFDNDDNPHHQGGPMSIYGIVEGFGVITVGSRGFRAEKARIKALVIPGKKRHKFTDAVEHNYPDAQVFERKRDALEAFPLTLPNDVPTPETHPDFWTRSAS
jgi:hypothetical protein